MNDNNQAKKTPQHRNMPRMSITVDRETQQILRDLAKANYTNCSHMARVLIHRAAKLQQAAA